MKTQEFVNAYYKNIVDLFNNIEVTGLLDGSKYTFSEGMEKASSLIALKQAYGNKLMFIGNGASAAISSHMAADFSKNAKVRAQAFNDGSLLTCLGNDYGYKHVFEKSMEFYADRGDILFAISSSGRSENILRATASARTKECNIITLSGFNRDNPLSSEGDINFYVPYNEYGPVEVIHHSICHCLLETIINKTNG